MKFKVAIIGRKNVGKSTLFNRLTKTQDALTSNTPGLTRDRKYGYIINTHKTIYIIDTAGITNDKNTLDKKIWNQTLIAIQESNLILFVVNAFDGITIEDMEIAKKIKIYKKKTIVLPNKIDKILINYANYEFYSLGFKDIHPISAQYGTKLKSLIKKYIYPILEDDIIIKKIKDQYSYCNENSIKITVIGKPNVGKSTLINTLTKSKRLITDNQPGTTRDSILIPFQIYKKNFIFTDTAGIIKNRENHIDNIIIKNTFQNIKHTNMVILVIDATNNISKHDLSLCACIIKLGKSIVIIINKCDLLTKKEKSILKENINFKLKFAKFISIYLISAKYKIGIDKTIKGIYKIQNSTIKKINTAQLTKIMFSAVHNQKPSTIHGKKIQLKYAHPGGYQPLIIIIHGKRTQYIKNNYKKYLKNYFQNILNITSTPIILRFKNHTNTNLNKK